MSCDANPQFTDWSEQTFKKIVYATNPPGVGPGLNYLDYGSYVPPGSDPDVTPAVGMAVSSGVTEPCYKFFLSTKTGRDQGMYLMPNPDARGVRTDCRYGAARVNGQMVTGPNGTLLTQDTFPHDQCAVDTNAVGCPVDADDNTDSVVTCLQNCQLGTLHNSRQGVRDNGDTVQFQLGNWRIPAPKNQTGTSFQSVYYNYPSNPKLEKGTVYNGTQPLFGGKMCTWLETRFKSGGSPFPYYASVLDFTPNNVGRSTIANATTGNSICVPDHGLDSEEVSIIQQAPEYLDEDNAMRCCQAQNYDDPQWQQVCKNTVFDNSGGSSGACSDLFQRYCMKNWGDVKSCPTGTLCNNFIHRPSSTMAITDTLFNYITSANRSGPASEYGNGTSPSTPAENPQDYISYGMRSNYNSPSANYYNAHGCSVRPNTCDASDGTYQVSSPCCRDDSLDPFFRAGVPQMCGANPNACNTILPTFCAQFSRDDLNKDETLAAMCGCYLVSNATSSTTTLNSLGGESLNMIGQPLTTSPYYTSVVGAPGCDPLCRTAFVQNPSLGDKKCGSTCVMEDVTVNSVNSSINGGIDISQVCPPNQAGDTQCYISNVSVNSINSTIQGGVKMTQNCGSCFVYDETDGPSQSKCVLCSDLTTPCGQTDPSNPTNPSNPNNPPGGSINKNPPSSGDTSSSGSGIGAWFKRHSTFLLILFLVIVVIVIISYVAKPSNTQNPDMSFDGDYDDISSI